jgi:Family of unknown function (DUF5993)
MDTIIFLLILATFFALATHRRRLGLALFIVSLAATLLLFNHHVTSALPLSF